MGYGSSDRISNCCRHLVGSVQQTHEQRITPALPPSSPSNPRYYRLQKNPKQSGTRSCLGRIMRYQRRTLIPRASHFTGDERWQSRRNRLPLSRQVINAQAERATRSNACSTCSRLDFILVRCIRRTNSRTDSPTRRNCKAWTSS